jgi:hypothetical protein
MLQLHGWTRLAASLAAVAAAILFGHFVVYRSLIVPALPEMRAVPLWMWAIAHAAEVAAVLGSGAGIRTWRAVTVYAVAAASLRVVLTYAFAVTHQPGYHKSFEAPAFDIAKALPVGAVTYGALLAAASRRSRAAARRAFVGTPP